MSVPLTVYTGRVALANCQRLEAILKPLMLVMNIVGPVATALMPGEIYTYTGFVV